jgi:hypothetical protein
VLAKQLLKILLAIKAVRSGSRLTSETLLLRDVQRIMAGNKSLDL